MQLKTGNYLPPVDIEGNSESEVEATALSLDVLMERTRQAQARFIYSLILNSYLKFLCHILIQELLIIH